MRCDALLRRFLYICRQRVIADVFFMHKLFWYNFHELSACMKYIYLWPVAADFVKIRATVSIWYISEMVWNKKWKIKFCSSWEQCRWSLYNPFPYQYLNRPLVQQIRIWTSVPFFINMQTLSFKEMHSKIPFSECRLLGPQGVHGFLYICRQRVIADVFFMHKLFWYNFHELSACMKYIYLWPVAADFVKIRATVSIWYISEMVWNKKWKIKFCSSWEQCRWSLYNPFPYQYLNRPLVQQIRIWTSVPFFINMQTLSFKEMHSKIPFSECRLLGPQGVHGAYNSPPPPPPPPPPPVCPPGLPQELCYQGFLQESQTNHGNEIRLLFFRRTAIRLLYHAWMEWHRNYFTCLSAFQLRLWTHR